MSSASKPAAAVNKHALPYVSSKPALIPHLLLLALSIAPLFIHVPTNFNVVATASLAVYCGCWRSVKATEPTETMSKGDAMRFPIVGSCVLFGLFLLFKFLPARIVNALLSFYLGGVAVFVLVSAVTPYVVNFFPEAVQSNQLVAPPFKIPYLIDATEERVSATLPEIIVGVFATGFCSWYFMSKFWLANNILGLAFSLEGIEHLNIGSVQIGCILLVGLFFYDIFWVFCTPVMVSVAKNFDAPIKLLFPRLGMLDSGKRPFSMLGLGDIVIPGIFVAIMLRYDVKNGFRTKYFQSCFGGYVLGISTTLFVMVFFNAAQPALLYIVPAILGCTGIHAWINGEFKQVYDYSEEVKAEVEASGEETKKSQ